MKASPKLLQALKKHGFMGETYEDVVWRLLQKDKTKQGKQSIMDKKIADKR